jgi:hypothetical protein
MQGLREVPSSTERDALTKARLGQGLFRHRVAELELACRVTGLKQQQFLWFSFDAGGELICENGAARDALRCWGIDGANLIRPFSRDQEQFLRAHREALRR